MATWTFVVEFEGGTYSSQLDAETLKDAVSKYNSNDPSERRAVPLDAKAVELTGLKNIFFTSGLTEKDERSILANIIKTDISK